MKPGYDPRKNAWNIRERGLAFDDIATLDWDNAIIWRDGRKDYGEDRYQALADGAELIILAPGVKEFGEDKTIDGLIRKYGYKGTAATLKAVETQTDIANDLSAAAHLIHGSSDGRFTITWCPGHLTREEVEGVGFNYGDLNEMVKRYDPTKLSLGINQVDGEEIFFISNPGLGLWAHSSRL